MFKEQQQYYNTLRYEVQEPETLKRLLKGRLNFSENALYKLKKNGRVSVNGVISPFGSKIYKGDLVKIDLSEDPSEFAPQNLDVTVIYEDFDVLVVNKPPYMVVHPTKGHVSGTLANGITYLQNAKNEPIHVRFINRLDMNTSGLVMVAKNTFAHQQIGLDMTKDMVRKKYLALVHGVVICDSGIIDAPIYRNTEESIKSIVDERGQASVTKYSVLRRYKSATLLEVELLTGRTHQIRVHLAHIGHGIIGDELYGHADATLINRQALHAYYLAFNQPRTKERIELTIDLPEDMQMLIDRLALEQV